MVVRTWLCIIQISNPFLLLQCLLYLFNILASTWVSYVTPAFLASHRFGITGHSWSLLIFLWLRAHIVQILRSPNNFVSFSTSRYNIPADLTKYNRDSGRSIWLQISPYGIFSLHWNIRFACVWLVSKFSCIIM